MDLQMLSLSLIKKKMVLSRVNVEQCKKIIKYDKIKNRQIKNKIKYKVT